MYSCFTWRCPRRLNAIKIFSLFVFILPEQQYSSALNYLYFVSQLQANQMVQNIREAFIENLETVNWMDSQTKQAAKEKVRDLRNSRKNSLRVLSD